MKKHHVIDKDLDSAIELFFGNRDWEGLYLTGGTCLAEYYFGHRTSVDIDLFTQDRSLFEMARRVLSQEDFFPFGRLKTQRSFPDFSEFLLLRPRQDPIKIDIVLDIPVRLGEKIKFGKVWLDSLPDLTANKLGCVIHRDEVKDYLDLFYLIPSVDLPLRQLIELGQKKDAGLDPLVLAHQLRFIQKMKEPPPFFLANVPWKHVLHFFSELRRRLLDSLEETGPAL